MGKEEPGAEVVHFQAPASCDCESSQCFKHWTRTWSRSGLELNGKTDF